MTDFKELLMEVGYSNIIDNGRELRMKPIYRDSSSNTVLSVRKDTGHFIDFSRSLSGPFEELVRMSLKFKDSSEAVDWLANKNFTRENKIKYKPNIKVQKKFSKDSLEKIIPDHSYWRERGISLSTVAQFNGGICLTGKMKDRYVFPIFNSKKELVGVSGRDLTGSESKPKWKHIGDKSQWRFPLQINYKTLKDSEEVILVESIGDMLALWEADVQNVLVTFGIDVSINLLNLLLKMDFSSIVVAFNNDEKNNYAGNLAAQKNKKKLLKYFDEGQVKVHLPTKKDFGEMSTLEILKWKDDDG